MYIFKFIRTIPREGKLLYPVFNVLICSTWSFDQYKICHISCQILNTGPLTEISKFKKLLQHITVIWMIFFSLLKRTPTSKCFYFSSSQTVKALSAGSQHSFIYSVTQSCEAPASQRLISHQQFAAAVTLNIHSTGAAICGWRTPACLDAAIKGVTCWVRTCPWAAASAFQPTSPASWFLPRRRRRWLTSATQVLHHAFFSFVCLFFSWFIQPAVLR